MKICPLGAELFNEDRRTVWHEKANNRFSQTALHMRQKITSTQCTISMT